MVVKMMRWRPWPPLVTKKYEVKVVVRRLESCDLVREGLQRCNEDGSHNDQLGKLNVEVRWKGPKMALSSLRRTAVKRNFTREVESTTSKSGVQWDEEFRNVCSLSAYSKDNVFHPWEIAFTVFNGLNQGPKNKVAVVGTTLVNLAEFVSAVELKELELSIPLTSSGGGAESCFLLCISLSFLELRTTQETGVPVERSIVPSPSSPQLCETDSTEKDELSALKAGLRKVKIFTGYVSSRKAKKACREEEGSDGRCSGRSEDGEYNYPFDSDSLDDFEEGESDECKEDSSVRKSFSYGTLAYANYAGGSFYSNSKSNDEDEDWVYYSNHKSDVGCSHTDCPNSSVPEPSVLQSSKRGLLSWRKRKLRFRSPKAKGEPLLKKAYGDEGGDDIDFDRRQLSSDESVSFGFQKLEEDSSANRTSISEFGDDNFAIGSWERKEITSRDGYMRLQTQVFFASIDQRSERAAGESACTALVAVVADWLQNNHHLMPIKSQFDSLIREGSLEWRNLCENETYRERFPDKHFDLETVLQAKIRPLSVVSGKSFIGFFYPDGMDEGRFDVLHGAMSFDSIWDEISRTGLECPSNDEPQVYIVSWNDHFFILKVESEAYYIIDTLGERLYEGCNQAYILKFDSNTIIHKISNVAQESDDKKAIDQALVAAAEPKNQQVNGKEGCTIETVATKPEEPIKEENEVVCRGKESCKEYIKSFLAAIPIRELQADVRKGLMASTLLHQRLQIEFNYTRMLQQLPATQATQVTAVAVPPTAVAMQQVVVT